jgi:hypothetical protein
MNMTAYHCQLFNRNEQWYKGHYSKISRSLDTHTIIGWIELYNSSQVYEERIKQLRENNQNDKQNELDKMYHSDMAELMKAALESLRTSHVNMSQAKGNLIYLNKASYFIVMKN